MEILLKPRYRRAVVAGALGILFFVGICLTRAQSGGITNTLTARGATTLTIGSAFLWECKTTNTASTAQSAGQNIYLIYPDGTKFKIQTNGARTLGPKAALDTKSATTSSVFTTQTGAFTLECDAVSGTGTVLVSSTLPFTISPLPATLIPPRFTNLASAAGIAAINHKDTTDCYQFFGTGAAWADYDGDGLPDLFVTDYNGSSHLYHNNGNLTFTDVTATAFPQNNPLKFTRPEGVSWADYDNDGHPDLLVSTYGYPHLFHNNGDGTFTDVSVKAGLSNLNGRGIMASWADYDSDGFIDLYVAFYSNLCGATDKQYAGHLFHNNGDGTFSDVTNFMGGITNPALRGRAWSVTWFDFNNDNRPDLYIANDQGGTAGSHPDVLWRNDGSDGLGGWIFTDVSTSSGTATKQSPMGIGIGDYNRDGNMDIILSNLGFNILYKNNGNGTFTDVSMDSGFQRAQVPINGVISTSITWGLGFVDLNNDGYEDVMMSGGEISSTKSDMPKAVLVNNWNNHLTGLPGDGVFLDLTYASGATDVTVGRTAAFADFDADGYMDVIVCNLNNQPPELYRNEGPADGNTNNWLEVRLVGTGAAPLGALPHGSNLMGIGAKLTLTAGTDTQYRQIISGTSLGAGSQISTHFGMAQHTQADSLTILWPSGLTQSFANIPVNQRLVITENSSVFGNDPTPPRIPSPH